MKDVEQLFKTKDRFTPNWVIDNVWNLVGFSKLGLESTNNIVKHNICAGRGYKDMY
jgi:hypothetical protein